MIREFSTVRLKSDGRFAFVCDFEEDVIGDKDDPSCVRTVEVFNPKLPYEEWERFDCFLAELEEVVEAEGPSRLATYGNFDFIEIGNFWTEDTPPDQHYYIWVVRENDTASVWLRRGYATDFEPIGHLTRAQVTSLESTFCEIEIHTWKRDYRNTNWWCIGSNAWMITIFQGSGMLSTGGDNNYHHNLEKLCKAFRAIGLPVAFKEGYGLIYSQPTNKAVKRLRRTL